MSTALPSLAFTLVNHRDMFWLVRNGNDQLKMYSSFSSEQPRPLMDQNITYTLLQQHLRQDQQEQEGELKKCKDSQKLQLPTP